MPATIQTPSGVSATAAPRLPYKRIGRWQTTALLGEGRWTKVYRVTPDDRDPGLPADYALKVLRDEFANEHMAIGMLQREAFVASQVASPNLQTVLTLHTDEPPFYFVSPYLEGATLRSALDCSVPLNLPQILWVARQLAEAVQCLHSAGWIHGDIKPENVIVSPAGHATLIDLGFAKRIGQVDNKNVLQGTVAYAAPESFHAQLPSGAASDIYSLGVVLFETLTGRLPFSSSNASEVAVGHLHETPPTVRSFIPDIPNRVCRLVRRLLSKAPLRRPAADELVYRLTALEVEYFELRSALK